MAETTEKSGRPAAADGELWPSIEELHVDKAEEMGFQFAFATKEQGLELAAAQAAMLPENLAKGGTTRRREICGRRPSGSMTSKEVRSG
jgi:hypothetical protein